MLFSLTILFYKINQVYADCTTPPVVWDVGNGPFAKIGTLYFQDDAWSQNFYDLYDFTHSSGCNYLPESCTAYFNADGTQLDAT